jgi:hypothetical protein
VAVLFLRGSDWNILREVIDILTIGHGLFTKPFRHEPVRLISSVKSRLPTRYLEKSSLIKLW